MEYFLCTVGNEILYKISDFGPQTQFWNFPTPPPMVKQPLVGQGLIIIEASQSHSHTTHSVGLSDNNTHKRETSMSQAGFEPTIRASERP
jgi:hypothetical protein